MKTRFLIIIPIILLIGINLAAAPLRFIKNEKQEIPQYKQHPLEAEFCKPLLPSERKRNQNRALVLLIEFNDDELLEDNPETTGNGKFVQDPTGYPLTLGKPPHNYKFYQMQMEAVKQYYKAASLYFDDGFREYGLNLEYDIYPKPGPNGEHIAYTLPEAMSYYNPGTTDYELLVSRFEDYFQHSFLTADQDEAIDFSQYGHFVLIHAGSDWQHDINGDTPSDIPSFFIKIGDGKEVTVDDDVVISYACNVPETITQDVSTIEGDISVVSGYGLVNSVFVHEFGHSLGFVDLYNTRNNYPIVGYYDIMDSGGMGRLTFPINIDGDVDYDNPVAYYDIEGCLPILPGAWSRVLAWEEQFRYRGYLKDFSELSLDELIRLNPASKKPHSATGKLYFVKIPLNDHEYILLENRQVDPDGDGGTAVQSSEDKRAILYPTPISDAVLDSMTYEYDFLLPGWFRPTGEALGGGLVAWHIDEELLYKDNNFDNNTVNPSLAERSVKIIEADNIHDLGNPYAPSWSWRGTEFDPYFKFKPILNSDGQFLNWDIEDSDDGQLATHNDILSSTSNPQLMTNNGNPSIYSIYDISSYSTNLYDERTMTFKIGINSFEEIEVMTARDSIYMMGSIGNSFDFPSFPLASEGMIDFYQKIGTDWLENPLSGAISADLNTSKPITAMNYLPDNNQEGDEYVVIDRNTLHFFNPLTTEEESFFSLSFHSDITDVPIFLEELSLLVTPTAKHLYIDQDSLSIPNAKIAYDENNIIAISEGNLYLINPLNTRSMEIHPIGASTELYSPVVYEDESNPDFDAIFIQSDKGDIYKYDYQNIEKIFSLYPYEVNNPTQLALGNGFEQRSNHLSFAAEDKVFTIDLWGSLLENYPLHIEGKNFEPYSYPKIIRIYDTSLLLLPEQEGGYTAVDFYGNYRSEFSYIWDRKGKTSQYFWDEENRELNFFYIESGNVLIRANLSKIDSDPIIWDGQLNGKYGIFKGDQNNSGETGKTLQVRVYPNPARHGEVKFRLENAGNTASIRIFDIAGNEVYQRELEIINNNVYDIRWDTRGIATGVYYGIIKSNGDSKKVPIAIIN